MASVAIIPFRTLQSLARRGFATSMTSETIATELSTTEAAATRRRHYARPLLGLLLPVAVALSWEIVVRLGLSNGRLVPPPSKVFATLAELAESGELLRHITATMARVTAGFGFGVVAGTV